MKTYMVQFKRNDYAEVPREIIRMEQERMSDLMRENIIQNVYMSNTMENLWMIFKIDSKEELIDIIKTLPMCKLLYSEISELMG